MIEIVSDIHLLSKRLEIELNDFPVFYFEKYYTGQLINIVFFLEGKSVVPVAVSKHYFLRIAQLLFVPLEHNQRMTEEKEYVFLNLLVDYFKDNRLVDRILPSPSYCIFKASPTGSIYCPFGTYYLDLSKPAEELWERIHSKHKNVIRNAEKKEVELKIGKEQLPVFYELYVSTMQRSKLRYGTFQFFSALAEAMPDESLICAVVYYNDVAQGAVLMPYSNYGAYYIYGASAEKVTLTGCNNYLHWELIKLLKQSNVQRYDFVGARLSDVSNTKLSGIQMFKERFGSHLEKGFLWKMDLTRRCKLYDFLVRFKSRITNNSFQYIDIIDQERNNKYVKLE
jgi:hypothetical protein